MTGHNLRDITVLSQQKLVVPVFSAFLRKLKIIGSVWTLAFLEDSPLMSLQFRATHATKKQRNKRSLKINLVAI